MSYKKPSITTDGIVIKNRDILLVKRKNPPFKDLWALPGGFVEYKETTENAVMREVFEETGLKTKIIKLAGVYSDPNRDPRGHTITIVYMLEIIGGEMNANDDASEVKYFNLKNLPDLAFDHKEIIEKVTERFLK